MKRGMLLRKGDVTWCSLADVTYDLISITHDLKAAEPSLYQFIITHSLTLGFIYTTKKYNLLLVAMFNR